jgi:hypothetical protein
MDLTPSVGHQKGSLTWACWEVVEPWPEMQSSHLNRSVISGTGFTNPQEGYKAT